MRSSTEGLFKALRILEREIQSDDGVANAALAEAADRLAELERENAALREDKERLDWLSSQKDQPWLYWERPLRLTREAIDAFRKEAQP